MFKSRMENCPVHFKIRYHRGSRTEQKDKQEKQMITQTLISLETNVNTQAPFPFSRRLYEDLCLSIASIWKQGLQEVITLN